MRDTLDKVVRVIEADPHAGSSLTFYALVSTLKMENSGCLYALTRLRELSSEHRQLAYELGPKGIRANSIRAGVTDTPALRKIPGNDLLLDKAAESNPRGRLTTPEDVALAIGALAGPGGEFISGNVVGVDGGEDIVG